MQPYTDVLFSTAGPVRNVNVTVNNYPSGTVATIYADNGVTVTTNPLLTGNDGRFLFYAADGFYTITVSGAGIQTATIGPILLQDYATTTPIASKLAAPSGSALVGDIASGAGAVARTQQKVNRDVVSVKGYGALGDGTTDDSTAFQSAVNALPATGGTILVPDAAYVVNTAPTWGTKSILWNFGAGVTITGTQTTFPRQNTNTANVPVGPWMQSQSAVASPGGGGIAAFTVEMLQPATYVGQSAALYAGARGSNSNASSNVWAINCLISADAGAGGSYQCIEVDVNDYTASGTAVVKGISISGVGTQNPDIGLEIIRTQGSWKRGIDINYSILGIRILNTGNALTSGIVINSPVSFVDSLFSAKQLLNSGDCVLLQRNTDAGPAGSFFRAVNAANNATLFGVDITGTVSTANNVVATGLMQGQFFRATNVAGTAAAGQINYGATTATSATAGSNGAVPAQVVGYIIVNVAGTAQKIPYFNT
jgi:Pectate lyase superfamily protein